MLGRKERIDAQISDRATRRGLITNATLREIGLSRRAITDRCAAGRLIRIHQGVYFVGHADPTPLGRAEAAVLACGPRAALSHDSAAALYGLRKWPRVPEISSALQHKRPRIRTHQTLTLTLADVTIRHGIPITTAARTTADIAPRLTDTQLINLIHEARRNRDLPNPELKRLYALCPRAAGVYDSEEAPSRSVFQQEFKQFLVESDLPIPEFEARWEGFEVDAFYPDHRLIIELDGYHDHFPTGPLRSRPRTRRTRDRARVRHAADHLEAAQADTRAARTPVPRDPRRPERARAAVSSPADAVRDRSRRRRRAGHRRGARLLPGCAADGARPP